MEFVDYKCLESLLIDGEELIATEGIGSVISGMVSNFFKMITRFINIVINMFKKLANKLKSKKSTNKVNDKRVEPAKKNPPSDEDAKKVADDIKQRYENSSQYKMHKSQNDEDKKPSIPSSKVLADFKKCINEILQTTGSICSVYEYLTIRKTTTYNIEKSKEYLEWHVDTMREATSKFVSTYNHVSISLTETEKNLFINDLDTATASLQKHKDKLEKLNNDSKNNFTSEENMLYKSAMSAIPVTQNCISDLSNIINRVEIV